MIEYIDNFIVFFDKVWFFVKLGGWFVMSIMVRIWISWFIMNFMVEDVLGIVFKGMYDWNKYINEEELRRYFVGKEGWVSLRVLGVVYVFGVGWKEVEGSERLGNYFFGIWREG